MEIIISCMVTARKTLDILGQGHLPMPEFQVIHKPGASYSGRCMWKPSWGTSVIQVQRHMTQDERTLERIVAHEVIHHVEFMTLGLATKFLDHGSEFRKMMAQVNAVMGEDFVTIKCGEDYQHGQLPKPITLLLWRKRGAAKPCVTWFSRETPKTQRLMQRAAASPGSELRVAKTRNSIWAMFPKASTCRFGYPSDTHMAEAQQLWDMGQILLTDRV